MQKTLLALLMLIGTFASSNLMSVENKQVSSQCLQGAKDKSLLAKGDQEFIVLKKHGKLFFTFTPTSLVSSALGKWQASVTTPDNKTFKGPVIDVLATPATFVITVDHPILFGTYTVSVENLDVTGIPTGLNGGQSNLVNTSIQFVVVTNSFNTESVNLSLANLQNGPNNPGTIVEGYFVPFHHFIPE
jgi:hypothetical protein